MKKKKTVPIVVFPPHFIAIDEEPGIEVRHLTSDEVFAEVEEAVGQPSIFVFGRYPEFFSVAWNRAFVILLTDDLSTVEADYAQGANVILNRSMANVDELVKQIARNVEPCRVGRNNPTFVACERTIKPRWEPRNRPSH